VNPATRVLQQPADLGRPASGACLALGMFDGVHIGHQHLVRVLLDDARRLGVPAVVVTFDPHPLRVVRPDRAPRLLQSLPQRLRALAALGPDAILVVPFDEALSRVDGADFIRTLADGFHHLRSVTVGESFQFGHDRSGDVPLLRRLGAALGFGVNAVAPVRDDGQPVSSTRVRTALREGRLDEVARLLGRPYSIAGTVVPGDRRGHALGFPTANLDVPERELPPLGVYPARLVVDGIRHDAVLNLGNRPTVDAAATVPRLEIHVLDFDGDLYGRELEVEFGARLRPEHRFESLDALRAQIARDVAAARGALAGS